MTSTMLSRVSTWPKNELKKEKDLMNASLRKWVAVITGRTSWVSRVDYNNSTNVASFACFFNRSLEFGYIQTPVVIFVQVVTGLLHVVLDDRSRIKRILRNRDHDSSTWTANRGQHFQRRLENDYVVENKWQMSIRFIRKRKK
jgi:hypothetical protein